MVDISSELKIIVGLGKTGLSCIRYLAKQNANLIVVDNRLDPPGLRSEEHTSELQSH